MSISDCSSTVCSSDLDLPSNDFTSLFKTLDDDHGSYLSGQSNVFPYAIGRSYFDPILPPSRVDLGWRSNALHWLRRTPTDVAVHGWAIFSASDTAREAGAKHVEDDWRHFLLARRSTERRDGKSWVTTYKSRWPP